MRFLMTTVGSPADAPPSPEFMAEMDQFVAELSKAGVLLATGGLDPAGTRVDAAGGAITVTDGPFTETKEVILSFALLEVASAQEAVELAKRFWRIAGDGRGMIQQVFGPDDPPLWR